VPVVEFLEDLQERVRVRVRVRVRPG